MGPGGKTWVVCLQSRQRNSDHEKAERGGGCHPAWRQAIRGLCGVRNKLVDAEIHRENILSQGEATDREHDKGEGSSNAKRLRALSGGMQKPKSHSSGNESASGVHLHRREAGDHALQLRDVKEPAANYRQGDRGDDDSSASSEPI
jgi:hypothetical protein